MSNMNPKDIYESERAERLANVAPRRDADKVSEADGWNGAPQDRDAKRVRDARVAQLDWHRRAKGRVPDEAAIKAFLGEGGAA